MLVTKDKILELVPQRYPMVMIDSLLSCDENLVVSQLTIEKDNIFVDRLGFTAAGMMETMAQTSAARIGYLLRKKEGGKDKNIPVGVIGSIKNFRLYFQPVIGSVITTTVSIEHEVMNATVARGKVEAGGKLAAESDLQIFLTEDQSIQA